MKKLLLLALFATSSYGLTCSNGGGDVSAIQSAINGGGTVAISGTCAMGSSTVNVNNSVTVNGGATFSGNGAQFSINADNVTFTGMTFVSTGIQVYGGVTNRRSNLTVTNNTFRDFTNLNEGSGIGSQMVLEGATISGNHFSNFWVGGFSSTSSNPVGCCQAAAGIQVGSGIDNTSIVNNTFDEMEDDGIHIFFQGMIGNTGGFTGSNVTISYNTFTRVSRIAIEVQGTSNWPGGCPGGCVGSTPVAGFTVKGNYVHLPAWPWWNTYAYSLVEAASGSNDQFLNNTGIVESIVGTSSGFGYGIETPSYPGSQLIQGTVLASIYSGGGFTNIQDYAPGSAAAHDINNIVCGTGGPSIATNGAITLQANIVGSSCPGGVGSATSSIVPVFTSSNNQSFPSGGNGTWSASVVSNLSIKWVQFAVDSGSPVVTQELQDVNSNFPNDKKWLYHATFNTSGYSAGSHTLTATATDVSGASQSATQTFVIGQATPAPVISSFTAIPSSITSGSSTLAWVVTGAASLSISAGVGTVTGTSTTVSPSSTTTYVLSATNSSGTATKSVTVTVTSGTTVACLNNSGDPGLIQTAVNGGGSISISGTCAFGGTTVTIGSNTTVRGSGSNGNSSGHGATTNTVLNSNNFMFQSSGDGDKIDGFTFNNGGIHLTKNDTTNYTGQEGWTITNNTFQNLSGSADAVRVEHILGRGAGSNAHNSISNNQFTNIGEWGIYWGSGIDNTLIDNNFFNTITANPIKGFDDWFGGNQHAYTAHNVVISNNDMQQSLRIYIENQGQTGGCPGGCNAGAGWIDGTVISGNYIHNHHLPVNNEFDYSLFWGTNTQIINNTTVNGSTSCGFRLALAYENGMFGGHFQGNVAKGDQCNGTGPSWAGYFASQATIWFCDSHPGVCVNHCDNNIFQGSNNGGTPAIESEGYEDASATYPQIANYFTKSLSGFSGEGSSFTSAAFTSPDNQSFSGGGNGTWTYAVKSNLSIRQVVFSVDGTPVVTQQLSDISTTFTSDQKWLYHATFNTSAYSAGSHTITATATDVSAATNTATQTFTVGTGGPPALAIVSFGANPLSIASGGSSVLTWSVTGATSLTLSGVGTVSGTTMTVFPAVTTTYVLTATNGSQSANASTTVTVNPATTAPSISSFTALPSSIVAGNSTTLSWSQTGATSLSISGGVGPVTGASVRVNPSANTTYILTATNTVGSVTASAPVTVTQPGTGTAWPGHVATMFDLLQASDHAATTFASGVSASALIFPVASPSTFVPYQVATAEGELAQLCGVSSTAFTICPVGRGFGSTTAMTHAGAIPISGRIGAIYRNTLNARLIALETALTTATRHGSYPGTSTIGSWPGHIATNQELYVESDFAVGTLASSVTSIATSATLTAASTFVPYQIILWDSELSELCGVSGTALTICSGARGIDTTTGAAHSGGATVTGVIADLNYNRSATELVALEADLFGVAGSTSTCSPCAAGFNASWPNHPVTQSELRVAAAGSSIDASFHNRFVSELIALEADLAAHP